jgi:hypothetical protein
MNIFVTSACPTECAKHLDDKRVNKMCLESVQMLCTAINELGGEAPYKSTHKNHPCNMWVRVSRSNWHWLWQHTKALCIEYTKRRELKTGVGRRHACEDILDNILELSHYIPKGELTPFVNCAANKSVGVSYKHIEDTKLAYQMYLSDRWETDKRTPTWYGIER